MNDNEAAEREAEETRANAAFSVRDDLVDALQNFINGIQTGAIAFADQYLGGGNDKK